MDYLEVAEWKTYQHYKKRSPPWIKLHYDLLSSRTWVMLDDASRVLAVACMLIASRNDGLVPKDSEYMQRVAYLNAPPDFAQLLASGFLVNASTLQADASTMQALASTPQALARPETETETETEQRQSRAETDPDRCSSFTYGDLLERNFSWLGQPTGKQIPEYVALGPFTAEEIEAADTAISAAIEAGTTSGNWGYYIGIIKNNRAPSRKSKPKITGNAFVEAADG